MTRQSGRRRPELRLIVHCYPDTMTRNTTNSMLARGLTAAALIFAVVRVVLLFRYPLYINHDCALLLQQAELMVDGWMPYVDFIEINPPLILYLKALPIWAAHLLSIDTITAFHFSVLLLALWSTLSIRKTLALLPKADTSLATSAIPAAYLAFVTFFIGTEFGQREHIFVLLFFPFFFSRLIYGEASELSSWRAIVLGALGALGVCLKPAFLLIALLPEFYWFVVTRNFRRWLSPGFIAFTVTGFAYFAHFFLLPSAMYTAYFDRWMPEVLKHYGAYERGAAEIVLQRHFIVPLVITLLGLSAAYLLNVNAARRVRAVALAALAAAVAYYIQDKGWKYHALPLATSAVLIVASVAAWATDQMQAVSSQSTSPLRVASLARVAMAGLLVFFALSAYRIVTLNSMLAQKSAPGELYHAVDSLTSPGDTVQFVTTGVLPAYPLLVQLDLMPASRYLTCFPIAFAYEGVTRGQNETFPYNSVRERSALESVFLQELFDDLRARRPKVIAVAAHVHTQACPADFYLNDYMTQLPEFAFISENYSQGAELESFQLYIRN